MDFIGVNLCYTGFMTGVDDPLHFVRPLPPVVCVADIFGLFQNGVSIVGAAKSGGSLAAGLQLADSLRTSTMRAVHQQLHADSDPPAAAGAGPRGHLQRAATVQRDWQQGSGYVCLLVLKLLKGKILSAHYILFSCGVGHVESGQALS